MKIGIGIDTGGTCTDAVVYDFERRKILGEAKTLTTKSDLSAGILAALDQLPAGLIRQAEVLALSTTLVTNACVEDKTGHSKLIFFGGDPRVIDRYGDAYGLPPAHDMLILESGTKFSGEIVREPDWAQFSQDIQNSFDGLDGIGIVEINAMKNGAVVEKRARELVAARYDLPVVCGHELSTELNSLQRGASTLLNAGLIAVIQSFLRAIRTAMRERDIHAPLVIVRSDGSLMSEEFARTRPVETLLCGPAASVLGGYELAGTSDSVIVDMGGTTTDIALIRGGIPVMARDGVRIGRWKTTVDGLYIKTVGLGGDSAIHYRDGALILEEYRMAPLCVASEAHPAVLDNLRALEAEGICHTKYLHEHFLLVKADAADSPRYTAAEQAFCRALRGGPLSLRDAAAASGRDIYSMGIQRLIQDGVVQVCGLTPTDLMHIRGEFNRYSTEAARLAAAFVARNLGITVDELCGRVYDEIQRRLYIHIAEALLEQKNPRMRRQGVPAELKQFILDCFELARRGERDPLLSLRLETGCKLLGIGAPAGLFLPGVAALLGTEAVIPPHAGVANALGAVAGNIAAVCTVEIRPGYNSEHVTGYTVFGGRESRSFQTAEEAEAYAADEARAAARDEAVHRGARGRIDVTCELEKTEADVQGTQLYLGSRVTARATGSIGFCADGAG